MNSSEGSQAVTDPSYADRFFETLYDAYGQSFSVDELLFAAHTEHQDLKIFHNAKFGRVMTLDGVVQTTERDEFIYHEMLTHVPILAHGAARDVLIIGGGDGGILREVCRHEGVASVTMVEIDAAVVEMAKTYFPGHSDGAFEDPRFDLVIDDGANFVANTERRFDVVIVDSTDPIGPGEVLFEHDFYANCKRCMQPGGVLVTQNGVAFFQLEETLNTARRFRNVFADRWFYCAAVPSYIGGHMMFGWGTDNADLRKLDRATLEARFAAAGLDTRYYSSDIHAAAFALPRYVAQAVAGLDSE